MNYFLMSVVISCKTLIDTSLESRTNSFYLRFLINNMMTSIKMYLWELKLKFLRLHFKSNVI